MGRKKKLIIHMNPRNMYQKYRIPKHQQFMHKLHNKFLFSEIEEKSLPEFPIWLDSNERERGGGAVIKGDKLLRNDWNLGSFYLWNANLSFFASDWRGVAHLQRKVWIKLTINTLALVNKKKKLALEPDQSGEDTLTRVLTWQAVVLVLRVLTHRLCAVGIGDQTEAKK